MTLFGTPFYSKTALDVLALYAQDAISWKRLTVTAGLRWEHLNGYLPEQSSPASRFFPNLHAHVRRRLTTSSTGRRWARASAPPTT